jgi:hypothetical protein
MFRKYYLKSLLCLVLAILAFLGLDNQLWVGLLILAAFLAFTDSQNTVVSIADNQPGEGCPLNHFGDYIIDGDKSYGAFIDLCGSTVFVEVKSDALKAERLVQAKEIVRRKGLIDQSFKKFISEHPEYAERKVAYICSHSKHISQFEVFWEPEGYTLLRDFEFVQ